MSRFQLVEEYKGAFGAKRLCRVMREHGIAGLCLRKIRTTVPEINATLVPDLLKRDFTS